MSSFSNLTLVTALFDIGRGELSGGFTGTSESYLDKFKALLTTDATFVIFCDESVEKFVWEHRSPHNTKIFRKTLDDLRSFPFYDKVQAIRSSEEWLGIASWLPESSQATSELYNPFVMSKMFFLHDVSVHNPFDTKYFAWVDAGLEATVHISGYFVDDFEKKITRNMDKMLFAAFPYKNDNEVHGFKTSKLREFSYAKCVDYVVRGAFFGGNRHSIADMNHLYYHVLRDTLSAGLMGIEENIFTILSLRHSDKINLRMIEANGAMGSFFQDIKNERYDSKAEGDGSIAFYSLTYNAPEQFAMWATSFVEAYPKEFATYKKYVINNTTDDTFTERYKSLFREYNFEEIKFDNIGINDARLEVAKHFSTSPHSFMVFFEDDMLLRSDSDEVTKFNLKTHFDDIFNIASNIVVDEKLDFLKLSFDEYYGDNSENWGWYNLDNTERARIFQSGHHNTRIEKLAVARGVPYAIGDFHYCNWPIMVSRRGNEIIFMNKMHEYNFEQIWMGETCSKLFDGDMRVGCILGTIISHERKFQYTNRKENKLHCVRA